MTATTQQEILVMVPYVHSSWDLFLGTVARCRCFKSTSQKLCTANNGVVTGLLNTALILAATALDFATVRVGLQEQ